MAWALTSWKRQADSFHLLLGYGQADADKEEMPQAMRSPLSPSSPLSPTKGVGLLTAGSTPTVLLRNGQPFTAADKHVPAPLAAAVSSGGSGIVVPAAGNPPGVPSGGTGLAQAAVVGLQEVVDRCKYTIQVDWVAGEDEDAVALRLQSMIIVALPNPDDEVKVSLDVLRDEWLEHAEGEEKNACASPNQGLDEVARVASLGSWVNGEKFDQEVAAVVAECQVAAGEQSEGGSEKVKVDSGTCLGEARDESGVEAQGEDSLGGEWDEVPADGGVLEKLGEREKERERVGVRATLKVHKRREDLRAVALFRSAGTGAAPEGLGLLTRVLDPASVEEKGAQVLLTEDRLGYNRNWHSIVNLSLSGCQLTSVPPEVSRLVMLERLLLDNNRLTVLPPEIGQLTHLRKLRADHNMLVTVPVELRQCMSMEELLLEHNRLVRPLLDFSFMRQLLSLRLSGNPLEFFPEILPCVRLRHLSLANVRIDSNSDLTEVDVTIEVMETPSYFAASKHKLSTFFALIFRYPSVQHPLLASALARLAADVDNRAAIGKDDQAIRQILSMLLSEQNHVVRQGCLALTSLAGDPALLARLLKADVVNSVEVVMASVHDDTLIPATQFVASVALSSEAAATTFLTHALLRRLVALCTCASWKVQVEALLALGNLAFSAENRRALLAVEAFRESLRRLTLPKPGSGAPEEGQGEVRRAAIRCLAILGENEYLRRAVGGRPIGPRGVRILSMDGGGMRGMATVRMLRRIEAGIGRPIHEAFDVICGTSTGGMLAVAIGVKRMNLDQCEEIYKNLGKLVFAEPLPKDEQAATWRDRLDQMYKSGTQNLRIVVHGSKHHADEFERLLVEMCADDEGNMLIESAVKGGPKVFVVSTLVSVTPAQPFIFRNYQYPPGIPDAPNMLADATGAAFSSSTAAAAAAAAAGAVSSSASAAVPGPLSPSSAQSSSSVGGGGGVTGRAARLPFMGSCKHQLWEAIRASSAAPYYLDDFFREEGRWQDGAVVANNPSLIGLRETRLLFPDSPIDCLVSLGCGNLPCKQRSKGGWRLMDSGQVLIESACSVERAEEGLETLAPLIPEMKYWRFNPIDDRCGMELDETDPTIWMKLEAATQEYVEANEGAFDAACAQLAPAWEEEEGERGSGGGGGGEAAGGRAEGAGATTRSGPALGWRRRILLVEGRRSPEVEKPFRHTVTLQTYWQRHSIKADLHNCNAQPSQPPRSAKSPPEPPRLFSPTADAVTRKHSKTTAALDNNAAQQQGAPFTPAHTHAHAHAHVHAPSSTRPLLVTSPSGRRFLRPPSPPLLPSSTSAASQFFVDSPQQDDLPALNNASLEPTHSGRDFSGPTTRRSSWETAWDRALSGAAATKPPAPESRLRASLADTHPLTLSSAGAEDGGASPPWSPLTMPNLGHSLSPRAAALYERLLHSSGVGVVHLALHSDSRGLIISWETDVIALAEPGEMASSFLAEAVGSLWLEQQQKAGGPPTRRRGRRGRGVAMSALAASSAPLPRSLADLVSRHPRFTMAGALHRFIGRHTQVVGDGREVGAYVFRRTLPGARISVPDIRWMAGAWRDRLVVCSGFCHGFPGPWIDAFLDAGAKAVVAPESGEMPGRSRMPSKAWSASGRPIIADGVANNTTGVDEDGRFVITEGLAAGEADNDDGIRTAEDWGDGGSSTSTTMGDESDESDDDQSVNETVGEAAEVKDQKSVNGDSLTSSDWSNEESRGRDKGGAGSQGGEKRKRRTGSRNSRSAPKSMWSLEDLEQEQGRLWTAFYDKLYREGKGVQEALKEAMRAHTSVVSYKCYIGH